MCLMVCECLTPQKQDGNYKNAMRLALLMWLPYHEKFHGGAFVEEKPEASLSRLARKAQADPSICTVQKYSDAYVTLRSGVQSLSRRIGNLSEASVDTVKSRLTQTVNYLARGLLPWIERPAGDAGKGAVVHGVRHGWPGDVGFPTMQLGSLKEKELTIRMYESLSVLFFHGVYFPRPSVGVAPSGALSEQRKRAMANNLCAKRIAQWAYGEAMFGALPDDKTFYDRFKNGLEAARQVREDAARRESEQQRDAEARRQAFAALRCVKREDIAVCHKGEVKHFSLGGLYGVTNSLVSRPRER